MRKGGRDGGSKEEGDVGREDGGEREEGGREGETRVASFFHAVLCSIRCGRLGEPSAS